MLEASSLKQIGVQLISVTVQCPHARLVWDTWHNDLAKRVSIDSNGDIFDQVLDYLRYGSIILPAMTLEEMFLCDLDFYSIVDCSCRWDR